MASEAALAERQQQLDSCRARVEERDAALDERERRIGDLDALATHLARLVVLRERELDELRDQIDTLLVQARGYATRVRLQALRQAASIEGSASAAGVDRVPAVTAAPRGLEAARERVAAAETVAEAPESTFGVRPAAPLDLFEGMVQLEIGPLSDFSQLVGFEDAAGAIDAAKEISVSRFSKGRATIDLRLDRPTDLLRELARNSPVEFSIRSLRDGRLILDLDDRVRAA